jgi:hypothetical protein
VQITRTVLNQFLRESDPFGWAALQETLGNALIDLAGYPNNDPKMLDEAVRAYQAALGGIHGRAGATELAVIQNNMGVTLSNLGDRKDDPALKRKALAACHEALSVQTREDAPLSWARTSHGDKPCEASSRMRLAIQSRFVGLTSPRHSRTALASLRTSPRTATICGSKYAFGIFPPFQILRRPGNHFSIAFSLGTSELFLHRAQKAPSWRPGLSTVAGVLPGSARQPAR